MIKVSDYIVKRLVDYGVKDVFMISGGGAMHLNDSIGKCKDIRYICNHHEQASAIAAEGYGRTSGKLAVVIVTTGPGGTNTLTGVIGQWLDSVPVLYISGQVKFETTIESCRDTGLRQLGDQEINIIDMVKPVTKFAAMAKDPLEIRYLLDRAIYSATNGRPGPVWIDVPLNIQGAMIDENLLIEYPDKDIIEFNKEDIPLTEIIELLKKSRRPVFVAGHGIRISGARELFIDLIHKLNIPVVSTFNGFDLIPTEDPLFIGRIGTVGDRAGNFALQNSDLYLCVGSRNNIRQISYNWSCYAREAKKVIVDIDRAELNKPTIKAEIPVWADAGYFLQKFYDNLKEEDIPDFSSWLTWCQERKKNYPVVLPEYKEVKEYVNPYYFIHCLTECLSNEAIVVAGNGTACVALFQAGIVKKGQRMFWNSGCAGMGYDLPAAIGASISGGKKEVICLGGDGSLQMNIQELQTVAHHNLPVKIFYLNNDGYISIKQTQDNFFQGRYVACHRNSGVTFPDMSKVASAYGIGAFIIENHKDMKNKIMDILNYNGPLVCDVRLLSDYIFSPKLSSEKMPDGRIISKPLEDMYPFLDRNEFKRNMLIPEWISE